MTRILGASAVMVAFGISVAGMIMAVAGVRLRRPEIVRGAYAATYVNFGLLALAVSAVVGYLSHILLDACTSFGTQVLWPLTDRRFAASIVAVIDPVVTCACARPVPSIIASAATAIRRTNVLPEVVVDAFSFDGQRAHRLDAAASTERLHRIINELLLGRGALAS